MEQSAPAYALGQSDTRPWGDWRVIDVGPGYVVKRITVRPEQSLSLQRHRHRDEHWLVVTGTAQIVRGGETFRLDAGGTARIAREEVHRVTNPGAVDVVFIEVQLGTLLSEDDIERLDDVYGRIPPSDKRSGD